MKLVRLVAGLVVGVALVAGCEKKEPVKPTVPKPPAGPDVTPTASAAPAVTLAGPTTAATKPAVATAEPSVTKTPTTAPVANTDSAEPASAVVTNDSGISTDHVKQAQSEIANAIESLKNNKPEDARKSIEKVESIKEALPKVIYEQLITVRASLDSVEKARKTELPALTEGDNK